MPHKKKNKKCNCQAKNYVINLYMTIPAPCIYKSSYATNLSIGSNQQIGKPLNIF
jgi:hypothetical protein